MPNQFTPVTTSDQKAAFNQINNNFRKLDAESVTKKFGSGDNTVIIGKIGDSTGLQVGDSSGSYVLYGRAADGRIGTFQFIDERLVRFDGQYRDNRFGTLYYDTNGIPISLDGQAPDDGRQGHWTVPIGKNVLTELGG